MKLRMLYFARLRERFGLSSEHLEVPDEISHLADLIPWLRNRGPAWDDELAPGRPYRLAVNQDMATVDTSLGENDEVAIFPPVTGG